jgi:phosphocarrier protein HPr
MKTFSYVVKDAEGIHARPAGELVKLVKSFKSTVKIGKAGKTAQNASKIFGVMGLGVKQGESVDFTIEGEDEETAAAEIQKFMETNL